jgi:hypothetical protein
MPEQLCQLFMYVAFVTSWSEEHFIDDLVATHGQELFEHNCS